MNDSVPRYIEPSQKYINDLENNAAYMKIGFPHTSTNLLDLKKKLVKAEEYIEEERI